MDRCLVVANKTLLSDELLDEVRSRMGERPCEFHLLVPVSHPWRAWSDGSIKAAADETRCKPSPVRSQSFGWPTAPARRYQSFGISSPQATDRSAH